MSSVSFWRGGEIPIIEASTRTVGILNGMYVIDYSWKACANLIFRYTCSSFFTYLYVPSSLQNTTLLTVASDKGYISILKLLHKSGASVNEKNEVSERPSMNAYWKARNSFIEHFHFLKIQLDTLIYKRRMLIISFCINKQKTEVPIC